MTDVEDPDTDYAALFHAAQESQQKLQRRLVDNAIIGGATDAAALLDNEEAVNQMAKLAFQDAVDRVRPETFERTRPPGPSRRVKRRMSPRKAAKAARKRNR